MELTMTEQQLANFLDYFWMFYGPAGVYPIKGLTLEMAYKACRMTAALDPEFIGLDSDDRISACSMCCGMYGLPDPYESDS